MFLPSAPARRSSSTSPHARGDVPTLSALQLERSTFSPRPWGCSVEPAELAEPGELLPTPVGMFRSESHPFLMPPPSPHARGDVPYCGLDFQMDFLFSPRPWGCSGGEGDAGGEADLLPTPVGMFRPQSFQKTRTKTSPHARGDVPASSRSILPMRTLLPTPVGMFRERLRVGAAHAPSPHARGDVPQNQQDAKEAANFSPRPWGCSGGRRGLLACLRLLPTPVGMFRGPGPRGPRGRPSPHARGDVPSRTRTPDSEIDFSPRPWGCSEAADGPRDLARLLPTPVGMFRPRNNARTPRDTSPHARGDVPCLSHG